MMKLQSSVTHLLIRCIALGLVVGVVLGSACAQSGTVRDISGDLPSEIVMVIQGSEVRRYENDRAICFAWGAGTHGSVDCEDKPQ
jgi:hypothetical protein